MRFSVGDLRFNATVTDSATITSERTSAALRRLTIQFRAQKTEMHAQALEAALLRRTGGVFSLTDQGDPEAEWRIVDSGCTYIGAEPWGINHHTWSLEQVERIHCTLLRIGSLELTPYDYAEQSSDDGSLVLVARCILSTEALEAVRGLDGAFGVVRVGVSDAPRRMLLDDYVWGPASSQNRSIGVVVRCEDFRQPRVTLTASDVPVERVMLRRLLDPEQRHAARQVDDIDAWPL